ncbi:theronine dehydrogenase [Deinococcus sp.]|uniref:theronine dehydrogenase n=1 Tax=Deinococcus sp. TaxID=47478 RepID=UPI0025D3D3CE|nr:theronine dehydrogenase [Deinococcus sp.]
MNPVTRLIMERPCTLSWQTGPLRAPGPGEVLVRTLLSAVSVASELSLVVGNTPTGFPRQLGYQTLGRTVDGRRFVHTAGHVSAAVLGERDLIPVPDHVPDGVALAVVLGEETHKGIRKLAPQPGERMLIAGAGLLGLLTLFNLTRRGVQGVTAIEPQPERRALAELFGAQTVAAPGELTDESFDLGFECSAAPAGFTELLGRLRHGGRACVLSDGNWGTLSLPPAFHTRELSVVASSDGENYQSYARWLWTHADPLLGRLFEVRVSAEQLPDALTKLQTWPRPVSLVAEWQH